MLAKYLKKSGKNYLSDSENENLKFSSQPAQNPKKAVFFNFGQKIAYEGTALPDKIGTSMFNLTFGVTVSINSACYYCSQPEPGL